MNNPDMGPIVNETQMNRVLNYIYLGIKENAKLLAGGYRYTDGECKDGYFIKPTIFDCCNSDMTIVKEEIFGPVVTIQTFKTEKEAIILGVNERLEIWAENKYEEFFNNNIDRFSDVAEGLFTNE